MENIKNYYWMAITIPLLALLIYIISKRFTPKDKPKKMVGMSILAIIFGIFQVLYFMFTKKQISNMFIVFGICWIILGVGRLIYDYSKK